MSTVRRDALDTSGAAYHLERVGLTVNEQLTLSDLNDNTNTTFVQMAHYIRDNL